MLSKENLRRRTEEAANRIEQERLREEERLRLEAEEHERAAQRAQELKALRFRELRIAKRMVAGIFEEVVLASNRGDKELFVPYPTDAPEAFEIELAEAGFNFTKTYARGVGARIESRIRTLFSMVDESHVLATFLDRALQAIPVMQEDSRMAEEWTAAAILDVLAELEVECELFINEQARDYLDGSLYPFLEGLPLSEPAQMLRFTWRPAVLTQEVVALRGHIPSWMCCTSGTWLLQRVSECASKAADAGIHDAVFEFVPVPLDEEKWGSNAMSKLVHQGQPIGVTPFNATLMRSLFKALGFDTERRTLNGLDALRLAW